MARDDVNIKVSADVAEAIRMWRAMEQGPQAMANELDNLGKKGKSAGQMMQAEFGKMVGYWTSVAGGIAAATKAIGALINAQRQYNEMVKGASVPLDTMSRELYLLTDGDKSLKHIQQDMLRLARERSAQPVAAKDAMAALLGAGYQYDDVVRPGGSADAVLRTLAATNATGKGVDTKGLVDALTAHMDATSQSKSAENIEKVGASIQGLFAATKLEIADLQAFAPRAKNIYDITGLQNEQLAIASQFKDVTSAETGATAFHTAVLRLQAAKNIPRTAGALKELGLTPEDVSFDGTPQRFFQVQNTLAEAFERAGLEAGRIKSRLFGNEGLMAGNVIFSRAGAAQTRERLGMATNVAGMNFAAEAIETGQQGAANRADAAVMEAFGTKSFLDPETVRKNMMAELQKRGVGRIQQAIQGAVFDAAMLFPGADAESALRMGFPGTMTENVEFRNKVLSQSRADSIEIKHTFQDQDGVAIPVKSEVTKLNKAK